MKVIFDHSNPFLLAHGGVQVQIEETKLALERIGVEVDHLQWWNGSQVGNVIHYFGVPSRFYLELARQKQIPVVVTAFFSETCNRSDLHLRLQGLLVRTALALPFGRSIKAHLPWETFREASHVVVGLEAEREVLRRVYGVDDTRVSVVPLGLSPEFRCSGDEVARKDYLITVGTICRAKGSVELARLARQSQVPILFVGSPFSQEGAYWKEFQSLIDDRYVMHRPHLGSRRELAALLRSARGFVLLSRYENWSLAAHEAAACGLPLLLPQMKWSRECFGKNATYFPAAAEGKKECLQQFYRSQELPDPPQSGGWSWDEVAARLRQIYERLVSQVGR